LGGFNGLDSDPDFLAGEDSPQAIKERQATAIVRVRIGSFLANLKTVEHLQYPILL
jgi:hypothetical protein